MSSNSPRPTPRRPERAGSWGDASPAVADPRPDRQGPSRRVGRPSPGKDKPSAEGVSASGGIDLSDELAEMDRPGFLSSRPHFRRFLVHESPVSERVIVGMSGPLPRGRYGFFRAPGLFGLEQPCLTTCSRSGSLPGNLRKVRSGGAGGSGLTRRVGFCDKCFSEGRESCSLPSRSDPP